MWIILFFIYCLLMSGSYENTKCNKIYFPVEYTFACKFFFKALELAVQDGEIRQNRKMK